MHSAYWLVIKTLDFILFPFTVFVWIYFKFIRKYGIDMFENRMPITKWALLKIWVFPITDHYYDPIFNYKHSLLCSRELPGIDFNISEQLELIKQFSFRDELSQFPLIKDGTSNFYYHNWSYPPGDSEFLYSIIRLKKPKRVIEIWSGNSTLMVINAVKKNQELYTDYTCTHTCIEPYEQSMLEETGVVAIRERLEDIDRSIFSSLQENDILFIDSSHIIRPGWDVLIEYLEILPILNPWVLVHIHDIFTPNHYPAQWTRKGVSFWNEQYLVEAFLTHNNSFKIICMMNYLNLHHNKILTERFPILQSAAQNPGSLWIRKV